MARIYVEPKGRWLILSAKHGVLEPSEVIEPEETLKTKSKVERLAWGEKAAKEVLSRTEEGDSVIILAGEAYRKFLVDSLESAGRHVEVPLHGLRSGEQKQWLSRELRGEGTSVAKTPRAEGRKRPERASRRRSAVWNIPQVGACKQIGQSR